MSLPIRLLPFVLLFGCTTSAIQLDDDSGGDPSSDTASGDDTAAGGEDTAADTEPVPEPDYTVWSATRRFVADYSDMGVEPCDDTVNETGVALAEGSSDWEALHEQCGTCDYFYEVSVDAASVCSGYVELATTGWRGVTLGDDAAAVHLYYENDGDLVEYASDDGAAFDGTVIDYAYTSYVWSYFEVAVTGTVTYPLVAGE